MFPKLEGVVTPDLGVGSLAAAGAAEEGSGQPARLLSPGAGSCPPLPPRPPSSSLLLNPLLPASLFRWSPEWKFRADTSKVFWVLVGGFSGCWPALTEGARGWSASTFTQLLVPAWQHGPTPCLTHGKTARRTTGVERGKMGIWYRGCHGRRPRPCPLGQLDS